MQSFLIESVVFAAVPISSRHTLVLFAGKDRAESKIMLLNMPHMANFYDLIC